MLRWLTPTKILLTSHPIQFAPVLKQVDTDSNKGTETLNKNRTTDNNRTRAAPRLLSSKTLLVEVCTEKLWNLTNQTMLLTKLTVYSVFDYESLF